MLIIICRHPLKSTFKKVTIQDQSRIGNKHVRYVIALLAALYAANTLYAANYDTCYLCFLGHQSQAASCTRETALTLRDSLLLQ